MQLRTISIMAVGIAAASVLTNSGVAAGNVQRKTQRIPAGATYTVTNNNNGAYWWNESDGTAITTFGPHTPIYVSGSTRQEYTDANTSKCETYKPSTNWITEATCTGSSKQLWKSTKVIGNLFTITNVYLGTTECVKEGPSTGSPIGMQPCNGAAKEQWQWSAIVSIKSRR